MSQQNGTLPMGGSLNFRKITNLGDLQAHQVPVSFGWKMRNFLSGHWKGAAQHIASDLGGKVLGLVTLKSVLTGRTFSPDWTRLTLEQRTMLRQLLSLNTDVRKLASPFYGRVVDFDVLSYRVVTDAGVAFLANNFAGSGAAISTFKFHGFGTGTAAEGVGQTALQTELTTQYAVDSTRPTGSQSSSGAVYTTVGTLSPDSGGTIAVTEHGIFSASSSGTLWDRSQFSAVNLVAGSDSLQVTYNLTLSSGG
jgi:hypothetical protein